MINTIRNLCIAMVCVAIIVSTGLSMWVFVNNGDLSNSSTLSSHTISVANESSLEFGALTFASPTDFGFENYTISVQPCTAESKDDLYADVSFAPSITFTFSNYEGLQEDTDLYYYVTFSSTLPVFNESGYLSFDTSKPGQSATSLLKLPLRDENDELIVKTGEDGQPILDENNLPIYEIVESINPIFKYRSGKKPRNILDYRSLASLLNNSVGESVLTLHIISQ